MQVIGRHGEPFLDHPGWTHPQLDAALVRAALAGCARGVSWTIQAGRIRS